MRLICTLFAIVAAGVVAGCTTVQNPDGTTSRVLGFDSPEAQAKAIESVQAASRVLPFPFGSITEAVGTLLVTAVGVYAAKKKGEEIGWDLKDKEIADKSKVPPPAPPPA